LVFQSESSVDEDEESSQSADETGGRHAGQKDDWDLAIRFRDIQRYGYLDPKEKRDLGEKAVRSVIERARQSLGPVQKPYTYHWMNALEVAGLRGRNVQLELDVEETLLDRIAAVGREALPWYQVRTEKDHGLVLLLDTSLSMKGEKLALLGVTVAAVCESVPSEALCVLGFDSRIHVIKGFEETVSLEEAVSRTLSIPPGGFTHIELGLREARQRIENGKHPRARVILISDGRYTEGAHPLEEAIKLGVVFPVKIGKDPGGRTVMKELGDSGIGRFSEVREMSELPRFLLRAVRDWVR
jgi:Mg-chelatase subunit ChlD